MITTEAPPIDAKRHARLEGLAAANGDSRPSPESVSAEAREPAPLPRRILLSEDHEKTHQKLKALLDKDSRLILDTVADAPSALRALSEQNYSVFVADLAMPGLDAAELIREIQERHIPVTVIVTASHGSVDQAVQVMRSGAYDFLTKPIDAQHLKLIIQRVMRERSIQDQVVYLREQLEKRYTFHNIISKNARMHQMFELISNVAQTNTTVLIEGETGTGKEQVARAIHEASQVRTGPLVAVNCAAIPETLLESELFGHEKGAFTSAVGQRRGRFELAHGGTIFLDEVGDIPAPMQAKLLRVLQERRFERVGGTESIEVDVRVIGATNRSLLRLVQDGKFREDLYYRLNVVKIELPPLRERPEDIPLLASYFVEKYSQVGEPTKKIAPKTMDLLLQYRWPGNIRELENAIERACVTSLNGSILPENLPAEVLTHGPPKVPYTIDLNHPLPRLLDRICAEVEQEYIRKALEQSRGNVSRCATICGLSRRSLSAKLAIYQIRKEVYKEK